MLAPWVPSVAGRSTRMRFTAQWQRPEGVQELERQQINDWLSEWLVESEAAGRQGGYGVAVLRTALSGSVCSARGEGAKGRGGCLCA